MVFSKKMRHDKLNIKQFFIYHFYDFMFFPNLDNTFARSRALGCLFDPALQLEEYFICMWQQSEEKFFRSVVQSELAFFISSETPRNISVQVYSLFSPTQIEVREAGTPHPRKKIKTYLGFMGYLWALEWRKK